MDVVDVQVSFYAIRNEHGEWWKGISYTVQDGWIKDICNCRIYSRLSSANGKVTNIANNNPNDPVPEIVKLTVTKAEVIDQKERVKKAQQKKAMDEKIRAAEDAKWRMRSAKEALKRAQEEIEKLKGSYELV